MKTILLRFVIVTAMFLVWELASAHMDPLLYVSPSRVLAAAVDIIRLRTYPEFLTHLALTTWEIGAAYLLAVTVGVSLGFLLGARRLLGAIWEPILAALYAVPSVVWYPSLMLFFGLGANSKIAFGFLLGFFPIVLAVLAGVKQVNRHVVTVARSMGARPATIFWKVVLPGMAGTLVSGLRAGLALTVVGVLAGEILGSWAGLGYLVTYAYDRLNTADYVGLVFVTVVIVLVIDEGGRQIERRAGRWQA
jgi:ABC-type nitrate/sulfonate/bicarbonate transport system permease component